MKIALMYSGLPRHILSMYRNHMSHIFNTGEDIDIYFHFWDIWGYNDSGFGRSVSHRNSQELDEESRQQICSLLNPKKYIFENFSSAEEQLTPLIDKCTHRSFQKPYEFVGNAKSYVFQFYSIYKTFSLIEENYDIVVRLRSDIEFTPTHPHTQKFYIDDSVHTYSGYCYNDMNDQMGYGSMKSMEVYANTFNSLETMDAVHPESLLFEQLVNNKISIAKDWNIHYYLVR